MTLFLIILYLLVLFLFLNKHQKRWIRYGSIKSSHFSHINLHKYYVEEAVFTDYQVALNKYYRVVEDVAAYAIPIEIKYDLYDWTYSIYQFQDTTIGIRHLRKFNTIQLIKSTKPMSIKTFELDNPGLRI